MDEKKQVRKKRLYIGFFTILLLVVFAVSMNTGYASLSPGRLVQTLFGFGTSKEELILFDFRLPRISITILAGCALAVSGAILQSVTRNPLADPGILGINAGAGFMVVAFLSFFTSSSTWFVYLLPLVALIGGLGTAVVIYLLSYKKGEGVLPVRMVLVGVGMAAALSGATLTLASSFDRTQYDFYANWVAGNIWGDDWTFVLTLLPWVIILIPIAYMKSNKMNLLNLHEQVTVGLGVNVAKERMILIAIAVALASSAVSVTGGIGFVGLMAPHIARSLVGPRHQAFMPLTVVLGGVILLLADTIGRSILEPNGIPAGIMVTLIGAPYFMYLLAKK